MIAVTGATGFVRLHLLRALEKRGKQVRCLVRPSSPRRDRLRASLSEICEVDFEKTGDLRRAMRGCDTVIHILGLINGTEEALRQVNVGYTRNVVEAARTEGVGRFVFMSSVAAIRRHGSYGETKFQAEEIVRLEEVINYLLAQQTGQSVEKIEQDTQRDFYLSATEALQYGIIDQIVHKGPLAG